VNRIGKRERTPLFATAAKEWIEAKIGKSESTLRNYRQYVESLTSEFKDLLVCDIDIADIRALQRKRLKEGLGHRSTFFPAIRLVSEAMRAPRSFILSISNDR
jgi:hypothetical protein